MVGPMIKNSLIFICLFVAACFNATAHASVMLDVSLANFTQSATEVTFDIEATFSSLDPDDFVSSLVFGLENSSAGLMSAGPTPYGRFMVETFGYPWDGGVDDVNGRIVLDARTNLDYLSHDAPLILARLHISTVGLANDDYILSLNSPINYGQGRIDGVDNAEFNTISIKDVPFTVAGNQTVPEPNSMAILGIGAVALLWSRRRSV